MSNGHRTLLRKLRRDRELTISYVAMRTGINHATLSLVERRQMVPSATVRRQLEKFFKIPAEQLLADAPEAA